MKPSVETVDLTISSDDDSPSPGSGTAPAHRQPNKQPAPPGRDRSAPPAPSTAPQQQTVQHPPPPPPPPPPPSSAPQQQPPLHPAGRPPVGPPARQLTGPKGPVAEPHTSMFRSIPPVPTALRQQQHHQQQGLTTQGSNGNANATGAAADAWRRTVTAGSTGSEAKGDGRPGSPSRPAVPAGGRFGAAAIARAAAGTGPPVSVLPVAGGSGKDRPPPLQVTGGSGELQEAGGSAGASPSGRPTSPSPAPAIRPAPKISSAVGGRGNDRGPGKVKRMPDPPRQPKPVPSPAPPPPQPLAPVGSSSLGAGAPAAQPGQRTGDPPPPPPTSPPAEAKQAPAAQPAPEPSPSKVQGSKEGKQKKSKRNKDQDRDRDKDKGKSAGVPAPESQQEAAGRMEVEAGGGAGAGEEDDGDEDDGKPLIDRLPKGTKRRRGEVPTRSSSTQLKFPLGPGKRGSSGVQAGGPDSPGAPPAVAREQDMPDAEAQPGSGQITVKGLQSEEANREGNREAGQQGDVQKEGQGEEETDVGQKQGPQKAAEGDDDDDEEEEEEEEGRSAKAHKRSLRSHTSPGAGLGGCSAPPPPPPPASATAPAAAAQPVQGASAQVRAPHICAGRRLILSSSLHEICVPFFDDLMREAAKKYGGKAMEVEDGEESEGEQEQGQGSGLARKGSGTRGGRGGKGRGRGGKGKGGRGKKGSSTATSKGKGTNPAKDATPFHLACPDWLVAAKGEQLRGELGHVTIATLNEEEEEIVEQGGKKILKHGGQDIDLDMYYESIQYQVVDAILKGYLRENNLESLKGTTLMDVLTHLPAYLPVDERVEEYTVPDDDPRGQLRGQKGIRAREDVPSCHPIGPYAGFTHLSLHNHYFEKHSPRALIQDLVNLMKGAEQITPELEEEAWHLVDLLKGLDIGAGIKAAKALAPHLPPPPKHAHLAPYTAGEAEKGSCGAAAAVVVATAAAATGTGGAMTAGATAAVVVTVQTGSSTPLPTPAERCQAAAAALHSVLLEELTAAERQNGLEHLGLKPHEYQQCQAALEADPEVHEARMEADVADWEFQCNRFGADTHQMFFDMDLLPADRQKAAAKEGLGTHGLTTFAAAPHRNILGYANDPALDTSSEENYKACKTKDGRTWVKGNVGVVIVTIAGWPFQFMTTRPAVRKGEQFSYTYAWEYWDHLRKFNPKALAKYLKTLVKTVYLQRRADAAEASAKELSLQALPSSGRQGAPDDMTLLTRSYAGSTLPAAKTVAAAAAGAGEAAGAAGQGEEEEEGEEDEGVTGAESGPSPKRRASLADAAAACGGGVGGSPQSGRKHTQVVQVVVKTGHDSRDGQESVAPGAPAAARSHPGHPQLPPQASAFAGHQLPEGVVGAAGLPAVRVQQQQQQPLEGMGSGTVGGMEVTSPMAAPPPAAPAPSAPFTAQPAPSAAAPSASAMPPHQSFGSGMQGVVMQQQGYPGGMQQGMGPQMWAPGFTQQQWAQQQQMQMQQAQNMMGASQQLPQQQMVPQAVMPTQSLPQQQMQQQHQVQQQAVSMSSGGGMQPVASMPGMTPGVVPPANVMGMMGGPLPPQAIQMLVHQHFPHECQCLMQSYQMCIAAGQLQQAQVFTQRMYMLGQQAFQRHQVFLQHQALQQQQALQGQVMMAQMPQQTASTAAAQSLPAAVAPSLVPTTMVPAPVPASAPVMPAAPAPASAFVAPAAGAPATTVAPSTTAVPTAPTAPTSAAPQPLVVAPAPAPEGHAPAAAHAAITSAPAHPAPAAAAPAAEPQAPDLAAEVAEAVMKADHHHHPAPTKQPARGSVSSQSSDEEFLAAFGINLEELALATKFPPPPNWLPKKCIPPGSTIVLPPELWPKQPTG